MTTTKKAQISTLTKIALAILIFVILVALYIRLFGGLGTSSKQAAGNIDNYDGDAVINIVDKCPCNSGDIKNDGCPLNYKITGNNQGMEDKSCLSRLS